MSPSAQVVVAPRRNQPGTTWEPVAVTALSHPPKGGGSPEPPSRTTVKANHSRYVRRCVKCRVVRGNSSFPRKPDALWNVCRHCSDLEAAKSKRLRGTVRRLTRLTVDADELVKRLDGMRREIRRLELEVVSADQPDLLEAAP